MKDDFSHADIIARILSKNPWKTEGLLASALGISPNTWTAYKKNSSSFGLLDIPKICDVLGVTPRWLLFGDSGDAVISGEIGGLSEGAQDYLFTVPVMINYRGMPATRDIGIALNIRADILTDMGLALGDVAAFVIDQNTTSTHYPANSVIIMDTGGNVARPGAHYLLIAGEGFVIRRVASRLDGRYDLLDADDSKAPREIIDNLKDLNIAGRIVWLGKVV